MKTDKNIGYTISMKTQDKIIKNTHIQLKTSLPLYSESYTIPCTEDNTFHSHEFFEIGITLGGSVMHRTTDGQKSINRGTVYMIPIGQSHAISVPHFWHVQNVYLLPRLIFQSLNTNNSSNPLLGQFLLKLIDKNFQSVLYLGLPEELLRAIEGLIEANNKISLSNQYLLDHYRSNCLFNILMILCDAYYKQNPNETTHNDIRICKILDLIHENIYASTSFILNDITRQLALHPQYINKIVKKIFNTSLSNLILETKVEKSCELLLNGYSITETAQALSFYDHSHYNKYFLRYFGISPSQYRDKYNKSK